MPYLLTNNNLWFCFCMQNIKERCWEIFTNRALKYPHRQSRGFCVWILFGKCISISGGGGGSDSSIQSIWYSDDNNDKTLIWALCTHHHCRTKESRGRVNVSVNDALLSIYILFSYTKSAINKQQEETMLRCIRVYVLLKLIIFRARAVCWRVGKEKSKTQQTSSFGPKMAKKFLIHLNDLWNEVQVEKAKKKKSISN